ncbi:MAG: CRISPR-associated endoribonuclease Cas6 [Syntrophomonadaceae bacterium]|nr:CRISPR-associated endoribonuclease Cas6 [Bacillota bacterium]
MKADGSISVVMATLSDEMAAALDKMSGNIQGLLGRYPVVVSAQKAACAPVEKLWNRAEKIDSIDGLRINFLSPTSFRRAGKQWLFPDPGVVFQNVYLKAVEFFGDFFRNNLTPPSEYASQFMVSRYELATKQVDYGRYKIIGFCGYCVYDCRRMKLAYNCQSLAFLSALVEFTGIGYKTTMGMGQAECLPGKECRAHVKQ